ncbi:hypothetical protein CRE_26249 [Caenorhabditis remanei]|uniref:Uncharacterized protein n=1 Tax=Caenorhabditis remanei TaxID=31234 RepID=E3LQZ6_CAERE|nr:hypothetical protein CRE_26249 [Caenorhabditis remanei]
MVAATPIKTMWTIFLHLIDNLKTRASSSPSSSNPHSPLSPPTSKLNMQIVYEHLYDFGKPILAKDDMELIKKAYDAKFYSNGSKRNITKRESTTIMERLFGAIMITVEASSRPFPYRDRNVTNILDAFDIIKDKMDNEPSLSNKKRMAKWKKMLSKQVRYIYDTQYIKNVTVRIILDQ